MKFLAIFLVCLSLSSAVPTGRITNGDDAIPHEFPHQVSLQACGQHFCGGSILNERFILTAAHCQVEDEKVLVIAGAHNFAALNGHEQVTRMVKFIPHKDYSGDVAPYDIALIQVDPPLNFTDYVRPVSLPKANQQPVGEATISGWGSTSTTWDLVRPEVLQKANLEVYSQARCEEALPFSPYEESSNICAANESHETSICRGDSGGPLIQRNSRDQVVQIGVVSWGNVPCGVSKVPGVYTFVAKFVEWIETKMAENSA